MAVATAPRQLWTSHGLLTTLESLLAACRYVAAPVGRDPRLDLLRGFCVFAMVVDHVGGASWLYALTGGNRGPVTAAEGFVFLSGLVLGIVSRQRLTRTGLRAAIRATLSRALTLYRLTFAMTVAFVLLTICTNLSLWVDRSLFADVESWSTLAVAIASVRFTWHGTDILALYTLLIAAAPLALALLAYGRWRELLAGSWLLWAVFQVAPERAVLPWTIEHSDMFPFAAWQALFVSALVLGFYRQQLAAWASSLGHRPEGLSLGFKVGLGAATLALVIVCASVSSGHVLAMGSEAHPLIVADPFDKASLGIGRLLYFSGAATLIYAAVTLFWQPIERAFGWLLIPLGQASLYAYATHLFLVVAAYNIPPYVGSDQPGWELHNTIGQIFLVLVLWAMIKRRVLFSIIPR